MPIQTDQIVSDDTLSELGSVTREKLQSIFSRINQEFKTPLKIRATQPTADAKLNFEPSSVPTGDGANESVPALKSLVASLVASTIDFQTQATTGATFLISWPTPNIVGKFRRAGFTLLSSGSIQVLFSSEAATEGALANAGTLFVKSGLALGFIDLECTDVLGYFKTAASATSIIENAKITRFSAGSGSGSGSSTGSGGGELSDLMYNAMLRDSFSDLPDGTTTIDIAAGKTDAALYDSSNELVRLSYDASKTVTGTGTAMTLSGAPSFTIKNGDVLIVGSEVRKFTITNQTTITLESAFTADPSASACCVSQAIHTVDLNNFNNGGLGLSAASQFSGDVDEVMLGYGDTETLGDIIPNFGTAPVIAVSASTDATSWTTSRVRTTSLSSSEAVITCPTSNPNLYLRFFANKTTGSGAVNLLSYKVSFLKDIGQTAGAQYYTAFARPTSSIAQNCSIGLVGGKTRFTFTFPYTRGLNNGEASGSVLEVIANGQIVPRYTVGVTDSAQAYFTEIDDSTIEMDADYSASGLDFQFKVQRVGIIDTNTRNTTQIALHDDLLDQSLEAQVVPRFLTAVNGAPSASQFRSDITGRASIPDLSSMLSVQMGPQRIMTQEIYQLQTEFGPAGQQVFAAVNDKFNQIRFVGNWIFANGVHGQAIAGTNVGDYLEIVFYGTGINLLHLDAADTRNFVYSIDGGADSANIITAQASSVLLSRNYSTNILRSVVSGLSLGLHTIKIKNSVVILQMYGFEVLTETTSLRIAPGAVMKGKYKNSLSALQTVAYDSVFESGALGTKGGCVLVYLKNDGTIGKAVTPADATALYLTNASHVNEEVIRTHHWREFGAGRVDDFSIKATNAGALAFTLDDGSTTLAISDFNLNATTEAVQLNTANAFLTITFIGTGLDILRTDQATAIDGHTLTVDGVAQGSFTAIGTANLSRLEKICSGLPYGTHTVKITKTANAVGAIGIKQFIIYAPKKPALPVGSVEVTQYYKMANYIANTVQGTNTIATGIIRKMGMREFTYVGTWISPTVDATFLNGFNLASTTQNDYFQYSFFGTGFEYRFYTSSVITTIQVTVDGSTNLSAFTTSSYGQVSSFVAATGVITTIASGVPGNGVQVAGLALGWHTVRFAKTSAAAATFSSDALDIISPIHAPTINGPYVVQNTLSLGNNGFLDLRKFNKRDIVLSNQSNVSSAVKLANTTTTSVPFVPNPDLSITHNTKTGKVRISHCGLYLATTGGTYWTVAIDGKIMKQGTGYGYVPTTAYGNASIITIENLSMGAHKIDVYYRNTGGTATAFSDGLTSSMLTVEDEE